MSELTTILGGMIIDETFRGQMEQNIDETLDAYGIALDTRERTSLENIVETFKSGELDDCVAAFLLHCPEWPCSLMLMTPPSERGSTAKKGGAKKPTRSPVGAGGKKTINKAAARKTAGKRKKSAKKPFVKATRARRR